MYEIYGKSKEQALPVINIKALLFSVSFESQTDKQLVKCENEKQRLVCLLEEVEAQDNQDATVHVSDLLCNHERSACCVTHVGSTAFCTSNECALPPSTECCRHARAQTHTHTLTHRHQPTITHTAETCATVGASVHRMTSKRPVRTQNSSGYRCARRGRRV